MGRPPAQRCGQEAPGRGLERGRPGRGRAGAPSGEGPGRRRRRASPRGPWVARTPKAGLPFTVTSERPFPFGRLFVPGKWLRRRAASSTRPRAPRTRRAVSAGRPGSGTALGTRPQEPLHAWAVRTLLGLLLTHVRRGAGAPAPEPCPPPEGPGPSEGPRSPRGRRLREPARCVKSNFEATGDTKELGVLGGNFCCICNLSYILYH